MRRRAALVWIWIAIVAIGLGLPREAVGSGAGRVGVDAPSKDGNAFGALPLERPDLRAYDDAPSWPVDLRTKFEPALLKRLLGDSAEPLRGIVMMRRQDTLRGMQLDGLDRALRRETIVRRLQSAASDSQQNVRAMLKEARRDSRVVMYEPLWIVNGLVVEGRKEIFWELAAHPDVSIILLDHVRTLPPFDAAQVQQDGVQWNVRRVQAERVWRSLEITGRGVVVASMDSGVDWRHPDLMARYRGYRGKSLVEHTGNWYCATDEGYTYPGDGHGHGTHTMGIMVGQNGIGVAPGAQWIAVKIFNNQGQALDSWIHAGFEWLLAPNGDPALAPDIVNNSWGSVAGDNETFVSDVRALRAAGIFVAFAAGNKGPQGGTVGSPASFTESFAVGATDDQDQIARFSSRGPSPWGEVKPEIVAPGLHIVSTLPGGAWGRKSGTSMATPHVAGAAALILQSNPALTVDQIESVLQRTARPLGESPPNNSYGWGRLDAYAAVVQAGNLGYLAGQVVDGSSLAPVAGAAVIIVSHSGSMTSTAETGDSGAYRVGLNAAFYDATFSAFGYAPQAVSAIRVVTAATTTLDVALAALPTGVLQGVVRERGAGAPLAAFLSVPGAPAATESDAGGAYRLVLPQGTHTVRVACSAHRVVTATVTITPGATLVYDFELAPAPTILLVDSGVWYNDSQRGAYQHALDALGYLYDLYVIDNVDLAPTSVPTRGTFLPYDLVIWSAPQDAPGYIGATAAITNFLTAGGRLLLSGQDVAYWDGGGSLIFYADYLHDYLMTRFVQDTAPGRTLAGDGIFAGLTITIAGDGRVVFAPDVIEVVEPDYAFGVWNYLSPPDAPEAGPFSGGQVVGVCLDYRALVLGFGLESIVQDAARRDVLQRSIDWLVSPRPAAGIELTLGAMPQIKPPGGRITHALRVRNLGRATTDTLALTLGGYAWPTSLSNPGAVSLGTCQSTTLQVEVDVPAAVGWHTFDTATLSVASTLSPGLIATASLLSKTPAPVLLVDGSRFYSFDDRYHAALQRAGILYDDHRVKHVWPWAVPHTDTLKMYPMVIWYTAYDWYDPLSDVEAARLRAFLDGGGRLLLSSQDMLYYKHNTPLAQTYLGVIDYAEALSATVVWGEAGQSIGWGLGPYTLTWPYKNWSDSLVPAGGAEVVFRNEHGWPAGVAQAGDRWRTTFVAFPLETLDADAAAQVMARSVGWLSWLGASTWAAERRVVQAGDVVTMRCVLRNDGWGDLASAHVTAVLPAELEWVSGSASAGLSYDPSSRTVSWHGGIGRNAAITASFRVQVTGTLADGAFVSFPARIGYDQHRLTFERPFVLRINAPDLSSSFLRVDPASSPPNRTLAYALTVRNSGVRDAVVTVTAALPDHAVFVGALDAGGAGEGQIAGGRLGWSGPVAVGGQVVLRYRLAVDGAGDYWQMHKADVVDQYGERWPVQISTRIWYWKTFFPLTFKRAPR